MFRVLFDTNIYGYLIVDEEKDTLRQRIKKSEEFKVYGFRLIRQELRDTPKNERLGRLGKRNLLLSLYDEITGGRTFRESSLISSLALTLYGAYRAFGGIRNWKQMHVDFLIVACASCHRLDIVVSNDASTLLSKPAQKAYRKILKHLPAFWDYTELRRRL